MRRHHPWLRLAALLAVPMAVRATETPSPTDPAALQAKLLATLSRHAEQLLGEDGSVVSLMGKTADGKEAWVFYLMFEMTGEPKEPLSKPSPINKNASLAMAAGLVGAYVRDLDSKRFEWLKLKADVCLYRQIICPCSRDGRTHPDTG